MATIFEQEPTLYSGARSPMIYTLNDAGSGRDGFQYVLDVYIYTGDPFSLPGSYNYRLKKPPLVNGLASFDISQLVKSEVQNLISPYDVTGITESGGGVVNIYCLAGWIDATGSDLQNNGSFVTWAGLGHYSYIDGFNTDVVGYDQGVHSKFKIREDGREFTSVFYDPNIGVEEVVLEGVNGDIFTFDLGALYDITGNLESQEKVLYVPIGYANLSEYNDANGPFEPLTNILNTGLYTVTYQSQAQVYQIIEVETFCEPKYNPYTLYFVNRFGSWDFLNFMKKSTEVNSSMGSKYTTRANTYQSNQLTYDTDQGQVRVYNVNGEKTITLNTGWVDENTAAAIQDILLSERLILEGYTRDAVTLESKSTTIKTGLNDKVINYTMTFKLASTLINTM